MWTLQQAIELINFLWDGVKCHEYALGLTGSVLYNGVSQKDLDIILYPMHDLHTDYRPALDYIKSKLDINSASTVERDTEVEQYKLVIKLELADDRTIDIFIPNFSYSGRLDNLKTVKSKAKIYV